MDASKSRHAVLKDSLQPLEARTLYEVDEDCVWRGGTKQDVAVDRVVHEQVFAAGWEAEGSRAAREPGGGTHEKVWSAGGGQGRPVAQRAGTQARPLMKSRSLLLLSLPSAGTTGGSSNVHTDSLERHSNRSASGDHQKTPSLVQPCPRPVTSLALSRDLRLAQSLSSESRCLRLDLLTTRSLRRRSDQSGEHERESFLSGAGEDELMWEVQMHSVPFRQSKV